MFPHKDKESDKKRTKTSSSTHIRRQCSTRGDDGRRCLEDGKYDSSKGKICGTCYDKTHQRTRVGTGASSFTTQERSSRRSSPNVSPNSSTDQRHLRQRPNTGTQSHHLQAPSDGRKGHASRSPSSGPLTTGYRPVSPDLTGSSTLGCLDSYPSFRTPASGQREDFIEHEQYIPPSERGQQRHLEESESCQPPQSPYHPHSPDLSSFSTPVTELAPRANATLMQFPNSHQTQDSNREYREGDLYSADSDPEEIRQRYPVASTAQQLARLERFQARAAQREPRQRERGPSNEQYVSSQYDSTTTAGAEGSSEFDQMPNVSDIRSQMRSTSILDPNVLATSDSRGSQDQGPSTSYAPLNPGSRPSSPLLPQAALVGLGNQQWLYNKQQWEQNKYAMQQQYLERYPADRPVSQNPEGLCAHLLFAMSLGEGEKCTLRVRRYRCPEDAVAGKRFFFCNEENQNDENNPQCYRGSTIKAVRTNECRQLIERFDEGRRTERACRRKTDPYSFYCNSPTHCDKNFNVPQPKLPQ